MALLALACAPLAAARGATVVSLTFDDGAATQLIARDQLAAHGMRGTFFINSGKVGSDPYYDMTWTEVASVAAAGDEIGGHTLDHKDLTSLEEANGAARSATTARICRGTGSIRSASRIRTGRTTRR